MPLEHRYGRNFCSTRNSVLAIINRRNLITFCSLLWHSLGICGLSLAFIIQEDLLLLSLILCFSINVNHENQQLNGSIRNVIAATIIIVVIWHLQCAKYSADDFYTLPHGTWHFLLLLYFSRQIKICYISTCVL